MNLSRSCLACSDLIALRAFAIRGSTPARLRAGVFLRLHRFAHRARSFDAGWGDAATTAGCTLCARYTTRSSSSPLVEATCGITRGQPNGRRTYDWNLNPTPVAKVCPVYDAHLRA